jgi:hypothetical protein
MQGQKPQPALTRIATAIQPVAIHRREFMRLMLTTVLALGLSVVPVLAETPEDILTEATTLATGLEDIGDRAFALEQVIEARAARGELKQAVALVRNESEAMVHANLWVALIQGTIRGPGPAKALTLSQEIPDQDILELAVGDIAAAYLAASDIPSARAAMALMQPGAEADSVAADIAGAYIASGNELEAIAVADSITDPIARDLARLAFLRYLATNDRLNDALAQLPAFGPDWPRELAQLALVRALAEAGRLPEAEAMIAASTELRVQLRGPAELAAVAAASGDIDQARARLAAIPDELEFRIGLVDAARAIALLQGTVAALAFIDSVAVFPEARLMTRDRVIGAVIASLLIDRQTGLARELLAALDDPKSRDDALVGMVSTLVETDPVAARADLMAIVSPKARLDAILAFLPADPDPALSAEALALARAEPDPVERVTDLSRIAAVLGS